MSHQVPSLKHTCLRRAVKRVRGMTACKRAERNPGPGEELVVENHFTVEVDARTTLPSTTHPGVHERRLKGKESKPQ